MDELLHQGELKLTRMTSVNGSTGICDGGNALRTIGNHAIYDGSFEWTKEGAIYGNQQITSGGMPICIVGGVPILSDNMTGYIDNTASYHPYQIKSGEAIVNSSSKLESTTNVFIDSELTNDGTLCSIFGGAYLWTSGNIVEHDNAFHYIDAVGKPYNPNYNVKTHHNEWYRKWHDNHMVWHEDSGSDTDEEKKFDYYDYAQTIFKSPFGDDVYENRVDATVSVKGEVTNIPLEAYASKAADDLAADKSKILDVIGRRKYEPQMVTPSFIRDGKDFWITAKSSSVVNGKVFQDGSWWAVVKASASAKCVAWADFVENKLTVKKENREYNDGDGSAWDGRIIEKMQNVKCDSYKTSKYGIADIGLTEYWLLDSAGKSNKVFTTYETPDKRSGYLIGESDFSYEKYYYRDVSAFGVTIKETSESATYHAYQVNIVPTVVLLGSVPSDGSGVVDVPIGDGFRIVASVDGTTHDIYYGSTLVTSYISFDAESNVMACKLSKDLYLVGVHGKGIFVVNASVPTEKDSGLRNYRLRYMNSTSEMKG